MTTQNTAIEAPAKLGPATKQTERGTIGPKPNFEKEWEWGPHDCALLSEAALAEDWLSDEDEEAWKKFQPK